jgi:hypothetical protein
MKLSLRKLALMSVLAISSVAMAQAPLYYTGSITDPQWDPTNPAEFTYANGKYTIKLDNATEGGQFKMSLVKGEWADFNTGVIGLADGYKLSIGEPQALASGSDSNIEIPGNGNFVITVDLNEMTITTTGNVIVSDEATPVYVRGDISSWNATVQMNYIGKDENQFDTYQIDLDELTGSFKIADASWGSINYGKSGTTVQKGDTITLNYNDNNLSANLTDVRLTFHHAGNRQPSDLEVAEKAGVENVMVDQNGAAKYYNLNGVAVKANTMVPGLYIKVVGGSASKVMVK